MLCKRVLTVCSQTDANRSKFDTKEQKILIFFKKGIDKAEKYGIIEARREENGRKAILSRYNKSPKGRRRPPPI